MHLPHAVEVVEVGPRDGLQNEPAMVSTEGKIAFLKALTVAGVKRFEATSFVSPKWIPQLADALESVPSPSRRPADGRWMGTGDWPKGRWHSHGRDAGR
jgi:hydroxymethylglutaryl-CoA lyase